MDRLRLGGCDAGAIAYRGEVRSQLEVPVLREALTVKAEPAVWVPMFAPDPSLTRKLLIAPGLTVKLVELGPVTPPVAVSPRV